MREITPIPNGNQYSLTTVYLLSEIGVARLGASQNHFRHRRGAATAYDRLEIEE